MEKGRKPVKLWVHIEVLDPATDEHQDYGMPISVSMGDLTPQQIAKLSHDLEWEEDKVAEALYNLLGDDSAEMEKSHVETS